MPGEDAVFFILKAPHFPPAEEASRMLGRINEAVVAQLAKWLKRDGDPVYLIVGVLIWDPTALSASSSSSRALSSRVSVPIGVTAGAAAGGIPLPIEKANPEVGASNTESGGATLKAKGESKRIFAMEYKTIRRKFFNLERLELKDRDREGQLVGISVTQHGRIH
ncbi:MAG: hypothetical protein M1813_000655 [Trichoglossum hirsutum]|nr:MAG: hypothetical protein M1813_000655 [Trichoglossum hirsutum]